MKPVGVELEKALGQRVQDARKHAKLTQQMLCHKAELSYSTLAKIERGAIKSPSIFTIQRISEALSISLDQLVTGHAYGGPVLKQQSKSGIQFVYFDIHGCMVRFFHRAFGRLAELSGEPADVVETIFWHYNDQICRGQMTIDEFNARLSHELHMANVDWMEYYLETVEPIREMHALAKWVAQYYQIGLLSNIMPDVIDAMLAHNIIPKLEYDAIVDSSVVGSIKPEPAIYQAAMDAAECDPSSILLIDDTRANIMAAERFGWHVLWFDNYHLDESIARIKKTLEPA